jgi:hypothetical protein
MGRITHSWVERDIDPLQQRRQRIVRMYEVPLVAQIAAPVGEQIYLGSVARLILFLKYDRENLDVASAAPGRSRLTFSATRPRGLGAGDPRDAEAGPARHIAGTADEAG